MWTKVVLIACITAPLGMSQNAPPAAPRIATGAVSFLGVAIQEIDSDRAKALKLPEEAGVEVTRIAPDSPAERPASRPAMCLRNTMGSAWKVWISFRAWFAKRLPDARCELGFSGTAPP